MPVFKKPAAQFNRAIQSLFRMSIKDIEIIAVFDGPDPVLEPHAKIWLKKNKRFKMKVIDHGGAPRARNAGATLAVGDYISFWDSDCYAEPEMAMMWLETFKKNPDCDFVYSGYKFTDPGIPGFDSEPFDSWTLGKYNYISSMFPVKHDKVLPWDEQLQGLQDWDYWRRIAANGKGRFIPGYGFWTEFPDKESISGQSDKRQERIRKIRAKHGDVTPDILVYGQTFKRDAIVLAKTLDADYFSSPFWHTEDYKMILSLGLHPQELMETSSVFGGAKKGTIKAIYWTGYDTDHFALSPYVQAKALMAAVNREIDENYAVDERVLGVLEDLGVKKTSLLPFPREPGEPAKALPEFFKVLAWADEDHFPQVQGIASALPDIPFEIVKENVFYDLKDYSVVLQFTNAKKLESGSRNALMMGRHVISNVQAPYAGYVEMDGDPTKFKDEIIFKIREIQKARPLNAEAQKYYLRESNPAVFKATIEKRIQPKPIPLEIV